jgi:uncharacterized repeat protein (TIGR01451 family)
MKSYLRGVKYNISSILAILLLSGGINFAMAYDIWLVTNQNKIIVIKNVETGLPTQELNATHVSVPDAYSHDFGDIGFAKDGSLYGISMTWGSPSALYTIDLNSGSIAQVTDLFPFEWGNALAFNPITGIGYAGGGLEDSSPYEYLKYFRSFINYDPGTSQTWYDMSSDYPNGGSAGDFAFANGYIYAIWLVPNGGIYEYYLLQFTSDGTSYQNLGRIDTAIGDTEGAWGLASDGQVLYASSPTSLYRVDTTATSANYTKIMDFTLNANEKVNGASSRWSDLSLTHTASDLSPDLNSTITLTTVVHNDGPYDASSVTVKVSLPAEYEYIQNNPDTGSYDPSIGEWTIGNLANGSSVSLRITVNILNIGVLESRAEIIHSAEGDPDSHTGSSFSIDDMNDTLPDDDEAIETISLEPSMTINKEVNIATVSTPATLTYTIDIDNTGNISLTDLNIIDHLPDGNNIILTTPTGDSDGDNELDIDEIWHYSIDYSITQAEIDIGTDITNRVSVSSNEIPVSIEDDASTSITHSAGITLNKEVNLSNISAPTILSYTFEVTNTGNISLSNIILNDILPDGQASFPALQSGDNNNNQVLDVGEVWIYSLEYTVTQAQIDTGATLVNHASVSSDQSVTAQDSASTNITWLPTLALDDSLEVLSYGTISGNLNQNDTLGSCHPSQARWILIDTPRHGNTILEDNGQYQYTPEADYVGIDSFRYQIVFPNDCPSSNIATVTINVDCATSQASDSGSAQGKISILLILFGYGFIGLYMLAREKAKI